MAFDRLLVRLLAVAPDRWVLKGALALDFRLGDRARVTKDMDLSRLDGAEEATADMIAIQGTAYDDWFFFEIEIVETLFPDAHTQTVRYRARSILAGRLFEEVLVDVGFSDPLGWAPEIVQGPSLLDFAGIEQLAIPMISLEQQIAEKLHAYVRSYGAGRSSSRVKDLVDLLLIMRRMKISATRLREAMIGVFGARGGLELPSRLPVPPQEWALSFRTLARSVGLDEDLESAYADAAAFLDPPLSGLAHGEWQPSTARWV